MKIKKRQKLRLGGSSLKKINLKFVEDIFTSIYYQDFVNEIFLC